MNTHILSYLGTWWGEGEPRFDSEYVKAYTDYLNNTGAVITWDIPIQHDGRIDRAFLEVLLALRGADTSFIESRSLAAAT